MRGEPKVPKHEGRLSWETGRWLLPTSSYRSELEDEALELELFDPPNRNRPCPRFLRPRLRPHQLRDGHNHAW